MIAILILCAATLVLIYYQVFTQGLFGSLIMAVLSLVSAIVALNYYSLLAAFLNDLGLASFGPKGISLLAIFCITLLILRELTDRYIRGNMNFPMLIDRIGSVFCAIVSSLTITGMVALGVQNMPVSATIIGFDRCPEINNPDADKSLFPFGDSFVTAMMNQASNFCFAGEDSFNQHHPNYLRELYLNRVTPEGFEGLRKEAATDALIIDEITYPESIESVENGSPLDVKSNETIICLRAKIKPGKGERGDRGAKDIDNAIRYALGHFRLVGFDAESATQPGVSAYPIGTYIDNARVYSEGSLDKGFHFKSGVTAHADLVFVWPGKVKTLRPLYLEFKGTARAELPDMKKQAGVEDAPSIPSDEGDE